MSWVTLYRRKVILQTEKFRFNFKHPLHHFPFKSLLIKAGTTLEGEGAEKASVPPELGVSEKSTERETVNSPPQNQNPNVVPERTEHSVVMAA